MAEKTKRPKRLVLVRHGESESNIYQMLMDKGEAFGYPPEFSKIRDWDVNLTKKGKSQAYKTGEYLKKKFGKFDACYVSPFNRTKQTFEEILKAYKDKKNTAEMLEHTRFDSRLREKDRGAIHFLSKDQIKRFYPHEFERREREGKLLFRPLGGESWYDVKDLRVGSILNTIYREHSGESVLVISHSIVIKCFRMKLDRLDEKEVMEIVDKESLDNCGIEVFERNEKTKSRRLFLKEWNTVAY